ncbi:hypothetical protein M422DRAFT_26184 [Sphaerobolus stellatus SS14]|nr:hypothetical protein M422DRAFT_26184 [Sphaerobolus stellatus SS14]
MVLGRLVHYAVDAVLLSTVIAGVRRSSGFTVDTPSLLTDPTVRSVADKFLSVGETVFDVVQASAVNSSYFKRK